MTDPSQYFKGRTVQEQMNEVIGYVDVRSAEVAVDAIASDVAQVHQDMLDADADATAAAASAAAAAGTLANAVKKTGESSQSIAGDIAVAGDLSAGGDLAVTGDAGVTGNLGVGGSTNVGNLTATGDVTVPTVATGTFDTKAVNGTKLKNEIDNDSMILRTAGNQTKTGVMTINPNANIPLILKKPTDERDVTPASNQYTTINVVDNNNVTVMGLTRGHYTSGQSELILSLVGENNKSVSLRMLVRQDSTGYVRITKPDGTTTDLTTW